MSLEKMYSSRSFKAMAVAVLIVIAVFNLASCQSVNDPVSSNDEKLSASLSPISDAQPSTKIAQLDRNLAKLGAKRVQVSEEIKAKLKVKQFATVQEAQAFIEEASRSLNFQKKGQGSVVARRGMIPDPNAPVPINPRFNPVEDYPSDYAEYSQLAIGSGLFSTVYFGFNRSFTLGSNGYQYQYSNLSTFVTGFPVGWTWQQQSISQDGSNLYPQFTIRGLVLWGIQTGGINIYYSMQVTVWVYYNSVTGERSISSYIGDPTSNP